MTAPINKKPLDTHGFTAQLAQNQSQEWVQESAKKSKDTEKTSGTKKSENIGHNKGVESLSDATSSASSSGLDFIQGSKPQLSPLTMLEQAAIKDPETMMLIIADTQGQLQQKGIEGATQEINANTLKGKQQRAERQEKLEERAQKMIEAQDAAAKAGIFGKIAGAFGISGGVLSMVVGGLLCATPFFGVGMNMVAGGALMTAASTVQTASPEAYQEILKGMSIISRELLKAAGVSEEDADMIGTTIVQAVITLTTAVLLGPVGGITAGVGGGMLSGGAQVGMAASNMVSAKHKQEADKLQADSEEFTKMLANNSIDQETTRKFMKALMDIQQESLDTIMDALTGIQDSKKQVISNLNTTI